MTLAIYVRVSTGMQVTEGTSLEVQTELCHNKAYELGYSVRETKVYREEGASGEDVNRPLLDELSRDVSSGLVTAVICTHPDRLSRDLTDKLVVCREFEKKGVALHFVDTEYKNTPEGQFFFNMQSAVAQYELAMIKKRTVRGRLKAVEKDKKIMPMRVAPYGYDLIDSSLVINEQEADFVKLVYNWYVKDRLTMREIGEKLRSFGAVPKRGESSYWNASSIMRILTSEIYIGNYYYNRRQTRKLSGEKTSNGNPKKTYEIRDKAEWVKIDVPKVIEEELYLLAQEQRKKNTKKSGNIKNDYLLKSLIRCAHCGRTWEATTYNGRTDKITGLKKKYSCYRCPNKNPRKYQGEAFKCQNGNTIRTELLDNFVWEKVRSFVLDPDMLFKWRMSRQKQPDARITTAIEALKKQIEQHEKDKQKIKTMFIREVISEDEMAKDIKSVNEIIAKIQYELDGLLLKNSMNKADALSFELTEQMLIKYRDEISEDEAALDFQKKRSIIERVVEDVIIDVNGKGVLITCTGILQGIGTIDVVLGSHRQEV